jgi:hypothetical protein
MLTGMLLFTMIMRRPSQESGQRGAHEARNREHIPTFG